MRLFFFLFLVSWFLTFSFRYVGEEQESHARAAVERQQATKVPDEIAELLNGDPASYWDKFYSTVKGWSSSLFFGFNPCFLELILTARILSFQITSLMIELG